jgi:hypothetical protein
MHAFGAVGVGVHLPTATATGIARSSQLGSSLPGQAVRCIIAGGPNHVSSTRLLQLSWAGRHVGLVLYGLRPLWFHYSINPALPPPLRLQQMSWGGRRSVPAL